MNWPEFIKEMQVNWIGRSEGVNFKEKVKDLDIEFEVFDTVPQTFLAQTFTVIAPEHPLVAELVKGTKYEQSVMEFVEKMKKKTIAGGNKAEKEVEGIFTGRYVDNPFGTGDLPIWIASYAVYGYGTGIVNCSAHDERDFAFAKKYGIPLKIVMLPSDDELAKRVQNFEICYHHEPDGIIQEPTEFKGMRWEEVLKPIIDYIEKKKLGKKAIHYHLRDWIFSRQRYWGEPIPLVHCKKCGVVAIPEDELPLKLPEVEKYEPTGTGESPLVAIPDWVNTKCPKCTGPAKRETNTMPQWAGSCWYYLRFIDPKNDKALVDKEKEKYWAPVDWYIGGAEHAVLHLLYARFWHKVLFDIGAVSNKEPFQKLSSVGLVLAADGRKMSKSLGNVITPDEIVKEYGADTLRLYEAFMGPFENTISWDPTSINGVYKFLNRVWEVINKEEGNEVESQVEIALNKLVAKVAKDIESMKFNTAVAFMMEFINFVFHKKLTNDQKKRFLVVLASFAPHITEELYQRISGSVNQRISESENSDVPIRRNTETPTNWSIHQQSWPMVNNKYLEQQEASIAVQINGKVRDVLMIQKDHLSDRKVVENLAKKSSKVNKFLENKVVKKVVYVPGKVINIVIGDKD